VLVHEVKNVGPPLRSGNRTSFGNGGLKNGSLCDGLANGDVMLCTRLDEDSDVIVDGA